MQQALQAVQHVVACMRCTQLHNQCARQTSAMHIASFRTCMRSHLCRRYGSFGSYGSLGSLSALDKSVKGASSAGHLLDPIKEVA